MAAKPATTPISIQLSETVCTAVILPHLSMPQYLDVSPESGSYAKNLGRLRTLDVIDSPRRGYVRAKDVLVPIAVGD
jgi:hypothetical protein